MIMEDAYPASIKCGMTKDEFFHSTLNDVYMRVMAHKEKEEAEAQKLEYLAWLAGAFNMSAIGSSFSKKIKYPESPLKENYVVVEDMELTEEEKIEWQNKLFAKLQGMAKKHKKKEQTAIQGK